MRPRILLTSAVVLFVSSSVHAATPSVATSKTEINQLVDTFKAAIIAKDGHKLDTLFVPEHDSWFSALDDASLAKTRVKRPEAQRFNASADTYKGFSKFVGTTTHAIEEKFSNVRIESDGIIGTVYFDYVFLLDGKPTNHGNETWQVIRTDDGWKINAMLYSVILDPAS
jgi:hypothetical protein